MGSSTKYDGKKYVDPAIRALLHRAKKQIEYIEETYAEKGGIPGVVFNLNQAGHCLNAIKRSIQDGT